MELIFLFLVGLCVGSFVNVLADRLPNGEDVLVSRSHCDYCKKVLSWYELIPILSYIVQKRRCRHCHKVLSFQYPFIELITGLGFVAIALMFSMYTGLFVALSVVFTMSMVILVADFKYFIIPDATLVVMGLVGLCSLFALPFQEVKIHVLSAVLAFVGFLLLYFFTKRKGMGFGDVKLAGVLGLLLGFPSLVIALYTAFLTGAMVGVILMIAGKAKMKTKMPFGPFLIIGMVVAFYGDSLFIIGG